MPEKQKAEDEELPPSEKDSGKELSETDKLRQELGVFKNKFEQTQTELEDFRSRYDEREDQFRRDYSRQGQELGERVKHLQDLIGRVIQPADETQGGKKKRPVVVNIPDNVTEQDKFLEFQQGLVEQVRELQEKLDEVSSVGGQVDGLRAELKKTQEDLNLSRYENLLAKEEADLREKYGLSDRDLGKVRNYMKESGIYSMEAAAVKTPGLDREKMYSFYLKQSGGTNGHDEEDPEERPKKKSRYNAEQVGKEMLKTKPDETVPRGGSKRIDENLDWESEMIQALEDNSFFKWPKAKQDEYEQKASNRAAEKQERKYY